MSPPSAFIERLKKFDANFIIGVAGDSGSGKTTFTQSIRRLIGDNLISSFSLDDYHTLDRDERKKTGRLALDPEINNLSLLAEHLALLKNGESVIKPIYNHSTGAFDPSEVFNPARFIIIEGLHTFYTEELRKLIDFGIFVDPEREIKWRWKIKRDVKDRCAREDEMLDTIMKREPFYKKFIDHQKIYSDVVIKIHPSKFNPAEDVAVELIQEIPKIPIKAMDLQLDISGMLRAKESNLSLEFKSDYYYGKPVSRITIEGQVKNESIMNLEKTILDYTGLEYDHHFNQKSKYTDAVGIAQLLICWRFLEKMDFLLQDLERVIK
jgi:phosphoribulokinase